MSSRRVIYSLIALTLFAFGLRCGAIVYLHSWRFPGALEHRQLAMNLVAGFGFSMRDWNFFGPSSVQGPIYPLILAGFFKWLGTDSDGAYAMAMLLNAMVGAACVPLLYQMIRTLGASFRVAMIGAALLALWPTQIYAVSYAQPVVLISASVIVLVTLFYRAMSRLAVRPWIAFCVLGMIATLLEPVLLWPMILTLAAILMMRAIPLQKRIEFAAIMLAAAVLIVGPWTMRNGVVHHEFVPVTSTFWSDFWKGNNPHATGTDRLPISDQQIAMLESGTTEGQRRDARFDSSRQFNTLAPQQRERLNHQPEIVRAHIFKHWALEWIAYHPLDYVQLCVIRFGKTLWADMDNPKAQSIYTILRAILLILSFVGAGVAIHMRSLHVFATMMFVVPMIYFSLTLTGARYAMPYEPLQLTAAALAIATMTSRAAVARKTAQDSLLSLDHEDVQPHHA